MAQKNLLQEELEALNSIKDLAQSYEEIAIVRMQQIRESGLKTRDFLADISDVYVDLKTSYNREIKDLLEQIKKRDSRLISTLQKKDKTLLVYLSSNSGLYGAVTQKTFKLFMNAVAKTQADKTDIVIIGSTGRAMYESSDTGRPYDFFTIPDATVEINHIKN